MISFEVGNSGLPRNLSGDNKKCHRKKSAGLRDSP